MNVKRLAAIAVLGLALLLIVAGCSGNSRFLALGGPTPTSPPTRTPRPTFTPRPEVTDTPEATDTPQATATSPATDTPVPQPTATKRIVIVPTRPRATQPPPPPPPPAGPTNTPAPSFQYLFFPLSCNAGDDPAICNIQSGGVKCIHAGNHYIDVFVASDYKDPNNTRLAGIKVRYAFSAGGPKIDPDETTGGDGKAEKTLTGNGVPLGVNVGTYYAWLVDGSGNQISNFSPPIPINALSEDHSNTCISAIVGFAAGH